MKITASIAIVFDDNARASWKVYGWSPASSDSRLPAAGANHSAFVGAHHPRNRTLYVEDH